ncbi:toxin-antitoxin system, toxin component, PIN family [delta proteobacterium NaphS2]|nr:toxin-antitoxin system, toxin component, PIN family [delta proteobacterium NaphS2]
MIVVTNSGPLIAMAKLGLLNLLPQIYAEIYVPGTVYQEVVERGEEGGFSDALQIKLAVQREQLIRMKAENTRSEVAELPLHRGEKEAIGLALEMKAGLVLLDDLLARSEAKKVGLSVKGTLGVIVDAHHKAFLSIEEIGMILDNIVARNDIWIASELCRSLFERLKKDG